MSSSPRPTTATRRRRPHSPPSALAYLFAMITLLALVAAAFSRALAPRFLHPPATRRCRADAEGSWSVGVFLGDSPFNLKPIEHWGISKDQGAAWPVANPAVTCADVEEAGFPSSFVANPFLFLQGDAIYMLFETKNSITSQGDIAAALSKDAGATWQPLGVVLDEEWHLSYPYVFSYNNREVMTHEIKLLESKLVVLLQGGMLTYYQAKNSAARSSREKCIPKLQVVKLRTVNKQERQACSCNHHKRGRKSCTPC